jgi:NAD(P)-dependent dehydrogenase (short-subunit alcohol dehydrogenase family)
MFPDLVGTRMLVIGAGGVGRTTAAHARVLGVEVVLADASREQLESARASVPDAVLHEVNVRDEGSLVGLLETAAADHIVLATGYVYFAPLGQVDVRKMMDYFADRLEPILVIGNWIARQPRRPRSLTIVSGFVGLPIPGNVAWSAMGPAIRGVTQHLAVELGPTRVNAVGPGPMVDSPLFRRAAGSDDNLRKAVAAIEAQLPIGRAVTLADAARQVLYAAGDPVATGCLRPVEGGVSLSPGPGVPKELHARGASKE